MNPRRSVRLTLRLATAPVRACRTARLILAALTCLRAAPAPADDQAGSVFRQVAPSLVTLTARDEQGRDAARGSAVSMGGGRLVTNCHLVREAFGLEATSDGHGYPARWISADPTRDLCVVQAEGYRAPAPRVRPLASVAVGERVFAVGNPLGFGLAVTSGLVALVTEVQGERVIVSTAPQSPGSSGGGLFDAGGRLLGITTAVLSNGQNVNLALPADWIGALVERAVPAPPAVEIPPPEPRWKEEAEALGAAGDWAALERHARDWRAAQPTSAPAATALALALDAQGHPQEAAASLREALALDDRHGEAWLRQAQFAYAAGRTSEAEAALERAGELQPSNGAIPHVRGEWLRLAGRLEEAEAALREAIRWQPGIAGFWRDLGRVQDALGDAQESARAYRAALRLAPDDDEMRQALARVLARQGQGDAALRLLGDAPAGARANAQTWLALGSGEVQRKRYPEAERAFRKTVELDPALWAGWANLGALLANTGRKGEALAAFDRALALVPPTPAALAETLTNRAIVRDALGDHAGALADAERATTTDAGFANAWRELGILKIAERDHRAAVAAYHKLFALGAGTADDWTTLGESLERLGQADEARTALEKGVELAPGGTRALQSLAAFHGRRGDPQRVLDGMEQALAIDSSDAVSWSNKGYALLQLDRPAEAVTALETAVSLDPGNASARINLGEAHMRQRDLGQAIKDLQQALTLAPEAQDARRFLAQCYLDTGQTGKAREQAQVLLAALPDQPQGLAIMTWAYLLDGGHESAAASFARLQAQDPRSARALRDKARALALPAAAALPE